VRFFAFFIAPLALQSTGLTFVPIIVLALLNVYALNAQTGAKLWIYATGGYVYHSSPTVVNGVVYIGSEDKNVYAIGNMSKSSTATPGQTKKSPSTPR